MQAVWAGDRPGDRAGKRQSGANQGTLARGFMASLLKYASMKIAGSRARPHDMQLLPAAATDGMIRGVAL